MENIKSCIIVDSSSGIKNGEYENVFMIPLTIVETENGVEKSYLDLVEIDSLGVITKLMNGVDLKTSQSSLGQMMEILEKLTVEYERIFVVSLSSGLSGTYNTWNIAKEEFQNCEINVLDARDLGVGIKSIVENVLEMIKENKQTIEVLDYIEQRKKRRLGTLVVTDVQHLKKGGRISATKAWLVDKLKLNIIITFDGCLNFFDKDKSIDGAIDKCIKKIDDETGFLTNGIKYATFYTTCLDENKNKEIKEIVDDKLNFNTKQEYLPSAIAVHTGSGVFAIYLEANK